MVGREPGDQALRVLQDFTGLVKDCWLARPQEDCSAAAAWAFVHRREEVERVCVGPDRRFDPKFHRFLVKYGASVVRLYNLKLLSNGLLDFSDLLIRAFALLADPRASALWRERFRFVHVDEVQDVSLAEYGLLSKLCGNARVLLCGDFNQTIYQWRGSDPGALIARFTEEFHPRVIEFTVNSAAPGLLAAERLSRTPRAGAGRRGHGIRRRRGRPLLRPPADEIHWIYGQIAPPSGSPTFPAPRSSPAPTRSVPTCAASCAPAASTTACRPCGSCSRTSCGCSSAPR
ncbi:MAG: UvrD-helicase domain-containing protein [Anaerotruncus massiliensis (ex Togo et al. 2019)]